MALEKYTKPQLIELHKRLLNDNNLLFDEKNELELQKNQLTEANRELNHKLLELTSLSQLEEKALEFGFIEPEEIVTLSIPSNTVASLE